MKIIQLSKFVAAPWGESFVQQPAEVEIGGVTFFSATPKSAGEAKKINDEINQVLAITGS